MVQPTVVEMGMSEQQLAMINSPAKVLWVGTGTKTGKTTALAAWLAAGIVNGEPCAWIGPWAKRTRTGYRAIQKILAPVEELGGFKFNDSDMRISGASGGTLEPFSGENPGSIFGDGFTRVVIDEASRMPAEALTNALTTVSATNGDIKLAFNLEHGAENWAIAGLLRVQGMTAEERAEEGEDFILMTTAEGGYVRPEVIERMRKKMPREMFEALYEAKIPQADVSLFHNLDAIFAAPVEDKPNPLCAYIQGVDLGRKKNFTASVVLNATEGRVVSLLRMKGIDWPLQYAKLDEQRKYWNVSTTWMDATGIGDPVKPELEKLGFNLEPVIFTEPMRKNLVDTLVIGCDSKRWSAPDTEEFEPLRHELMVFGIQLTRGGNIRYGAPEHEHDDCVFAMALVWHGRMSGRYGRILHERVSPSALLREVGLFG